MASTSTSGIIPFPSTSLTHINNVLTFQNQCLSTIQSFLPPDSWIIDSGASSHVCSDLAMFTSLSPVTSVSVSLPNGIQVPITHTGTIHITSALILHNVLLVPDFHFNLISVSCLTKTLNCAAHFFPIGCLLQDLTRGLMIGKGSLYNNLYILDKASPPSVSLASSVSTSSSVASPALPTAFCGSLLDEEQLWHHRLGHPSSNVLRKVSSSLPSFKTNVSDNSHCTICPLAKQKRLAFVSNNNLASQPFDLIHLDVWGPFSVDSIEGFRYFLTLVDDCTRFTWVYMLKQKSDVSVVFPAFITMIHTQFQVKIKAIRSDNAPELVFTDLLTKHGMMHQFSCAYTPQ